MLCLATKNKCVDCEAGQVYQSDTETCSSCERGQAAIDVVTPCAPCEAGKYQPNSGATAYGCTVCPGGRYTDNSESCTSCPKGTSLKNADTAAGTTESDCKKCPVKTYGPFDGAEECISCPTANDEGSSVCYANGTVAAPCNPGQFGTPGNCQDCDVGKYRGVDDDISSCLVCELGEYSARGSSKCLQCDSGKIGIKNGHCIECPRGFFQDKRGGTVCTECTLGTSTINAQTPCTDCELATFGSSPGVCSDCPPLTYSKTRGQVACDTCPAGVCFLFFAAVFFFCRFLLSFSILFLTFSCYFFWQLKRNQQTKTKMTVKDQNGNYQKTVHQTLNI